MRQQRSRGNMTGTLHWEIVTHDEAYEVVVDYTMTAIDPGVSIGPAELCYPPEGGEVELTSVRHWANNQPGEPVELTAADEAAIILHIQENPPEADDGYDG